MTIRGTDHKWAIVDAHKAPFLSNNRIKPEGPS